MAINLGARKEELIKKSSKSLSKSLSPGTGVFTINEITWDNNSYNDNDGIDITLHLEGEDLTAQGFEGFFIDMENQELGRHKGAVGKVKLSRYSYATKDYPASGNKAAQTVSREDAVVNEISKMSNILGLNDQLLEGVVADETAMVNKASHVFKGSKIRATIGGREYLDKNGYIKHSLYLVKADKGFYAYEAENALISKIQPFSSAKHIEKAKGGAGTAAVDAFEPTEIEFDDVFTV